MTLVESYMEILMTSFGGLKPTVDMDVLKRLHHAGDYTGLVAAIRDHLKLDIKLRVGLVNSGGSQNAAAWVSLPQPMPMYGTLAFKNTLATVYLRKSLIAVSTTEMIVVTIAHELSHIVLNGIGHRLRSEEKAVDLTAMILGFAGAYFEMRKVNSGMQLGYLDADELAQVRAIILRDTFGELNPRKSARPGPKNVTPKRRIIFPGWLPWRKKSR
jgi:hypothetical protein